MKPLRVIFFALISISIFQIGIAQNIEITLTSENSLLFEGCEDSIQFALEQPAEDQLIYTIMLDGTAEILLDYKLAIPNNKLLFEKGEQTLTYALIPIQDGINEFNERIDITYFLDKDSEVTGEASFPIFDDFDIAIKDIRDTIIICDGNQEITLSATEAATYLWESDFDIISGEDSVTVTMLTNDDGYIYLTGKTGECTAVDSIYINYVADEEYGFIVEDTEYICLGEEDKIDVQISPADATVTWSPNVSISDSTALSPIFNPDTTTVFYLKVVTEHCIYNDTVRIQVDSIPTVNLVSLPPPNENCGKYCVGDVIKLTSDDIIKSEDFPDIKYEWTPKDDLIDGIDSLQTAIITASSTKTFTRTYINNECIDTDTIEILVVDPILPILSDTVVCFEKPVDITIDDTDLTEISWEPEEGLSCTDCPNPIAIVGKTTTYTVTAMKENCCPVEASITITVRIPPIDIAPSITCPNVDLETNLNLEDNYTDPQWITNTDFLSCDDCFDPTVNISNNTTFVLQAMDENMCLSQGEFNVAIYPEVTTTITSNPSGTVPQGATVGFDVSTEPSQNVTYTWYYNGAKQSGTNASIDIKILNEGDENIIKVEYFDSNGCYRSAEISVTAIKPIIEMPNAFTPNNDEMNDRFRPIVKNAEYVPEFIQDFKIVNRFGRVIYEFEDDMEGWDGNLPNGDPAPPEVYLYYIDLLYPDGREETKKGDVTLIR